MDQPGMKYAAGFHFKNLVIEAWRDLDPFACYFQMA
jgi:hypothetical protein